MNTTVILSNIWAISAIIVALFFIVKWDFAMTWVDKTHKQWSQVPRAFVEAIMLTVMLVFIMTPGLNSWLAFCTLRKMFRFVVRLRYPNF